MLLSICAQNYYQFVRKNFSFYAQSNSKSYSGSMNNFINRFAKNAMSFSTQEIEYLRNLFASFLEACVDVPRDLFATKKGELNAALFDCVFAVVAGKYYKNNSLISEKIQADKICALKADTEFEEAITHSTSHTKMVEKRISKAHEYLQ